MYGCRGLGYESSVGFSVVRVGGGVGVWESTDLRMLVVLIDCLVVTVLYGFLVTFVVGVNLGWLYGIGCGVNFGRWWLLGKEGWWLVLGVVELG